MRGCLHERSRVMDPAPPSKIRLLLIDGHRVVAEALATLIGAEPDIEVVGRVATMRELNDGFDVEFNMVLTRFLLPDGNGADATRLVKRRWPLVKVVVLSAVSDHFATSSARRAGADAFVGRDGSMSDLIAVLRSTSLGTNENAWPVPASKPAHLNVSDVRRAQGEFELTAREMEVLTALARGDTSRQMCTELGIGQNTLRTHVQKIIGKLGVHSRLEAVAIAQREGIV